MGRKPGGQYFRAGAGAIIAGPDGRVLAFERSDSPGSWQLPQGGLRAEEAPLQAAFREVAEEAGISEEALELVAEYPEPLAYELPPRSRSAKTGRGQVQYWFLFRLRVPADGPSLPPQGEFRDWRWTSLERLTREVVPFRGPLYRRLEAYFRPHLEGGG